MCNTQKREEKERRQGKLCQKIDRFGNLKLFWSVTWKTWIEGQKHWALWKVLLYYNTIFEFFAVMKFSVISRFFAVQNINTFGSLSLKGITLPFASKYNTFKQRIRNFWSFWAFFAFFICFTFFTSSNFCCCFSVLLHEVVCHTSSFTI